MYVHVIELISVSGCIYYGSVVTMSVSFLHSVGSMVWKILYPTLAASLVGSVLYFSSAQNRATFRDKTGLMQHGYLGNVTVWKKKGETKDK